MGWEETDKRICRKNERAKLKEERADTRLEARRERKQLEESEVAAGTGHGVEKKVTQAEIARRLALTDGSKRNATQQSSSRASKIVDQPLLEPNLNREAAIVDASGLDAALYALETPGTRHC